MEFHGLITLKELWIITQHIKKELEEKSGEKDLKNWMI